VYLLAYIAYNNLVMLIIRHLAVTVQVFY